MEIKISGSSKEIAALVLELQGRRVPGESLKINPQALAQAIHGKV